MASILELMNALSRGGAAVLADAGVKSAVVLLAAAIAARLLRQAPAAVRHRLWSLGLSGALVMPLLSWVLPHMRLPLLPAKAAPAETAGESGGATPTKRPGEVAPIGSRVRGAHEEWGVPAANPIHLEDLRAAQAALPDSSRDEALLASSRTAVPLDARVYVLGVWMAGLAMVLVPLAAGSVVNWRLLRKSRRLTEARWLRLIGELSARIGLRRTVAAFESPQPVIPMTWGLLRPMVVVPEDWRNWPHERQRCVLLHELAHVKRLDVVFQMIGRLTAALYWFNPLVWFAVRQLRIERELACDDCVLASGERASDYARELLQIAKRYRLPPLAAGVAMAHSARLDQRVLRILDRARSRLSMSRRAARLLFVTAAVLVLGVAATSLVERSTSAVEGEDEQARPGKSVDVVSYTTNQVNAVAVSSDGKLVAGGGMDRSVRIWKLDSGELLHRLEGSQRIIRAVAFQPRGPLLASAGDEPVVRVWDVTAGAQVKTLRGLSPTLTSMSFSPDGKVLAGCSFRQKRPKQWQGEVMVWDVASGEAVRVVESQANGYYRGVAFSPDGSMLAAAFDSTGTSPSSGVKLWDSKTWELKQTLLRDRGASLSVAFSPDGRHVASGGGYVVVNDGRMATGEVKAWEIASGNIAAMLSRPDVGGYIAIAFSPFGAIAGQGFGGPTVKTATESRAISEVTYWNPATEQPIWNIQCAFCGDPTPPAFTPDGTKLITCDSEAVRVFDAKSGKALHLLMNVERSPVSSKTENAAVDKTSDDKPAAPDSPPRDAMQPASLSGRALDADGKPVAGAEIYLASVGQHGKLVAQTTTDAQGRYDFRDVALPVESFPSIGNAEHSTFQVFGRKQGLGFAWTPRRSLFLHAPAENLQSRSSEPIPGPDERFLPGDKIELDLALSSSARLVGQVVDERGKPIEGAEILIWGCERLSTDHFAWSKHFAALGYSTLVPAEMRIRKSGRDGRFEFDDLPTECRFRININTVDGPKRMIWAATTDTPQRGEPVGGLSILTGELKLIFPNPLDVPFQVLFGDTSLPAARVLVQTFDESGFQVNGSTDEEGRVTLRLPPGNYGIKLDPVRGTSYFSVPHIVNPRPVRFDVGDQPPEQPLVFRLHPAAAVDVTVVDAETGAGVAHVDVWEQGDPNEPLSRYEPAYESWDPETGGIWAERPRTDSHGKVRVLFQEGAHQIGVGLFNMPAGYEAVESNGQSVDCRIGKPVPLKFTLRKRKPPGGE